MKIMKHWAVILSLTVILILTFVAFFNVIRCEFTNWDDKDMIINNPLIKKIDFPHLKKMFLGFYWFHYMPLTLLSWGLEYHFFGLSSKVLHIDNLILHLINVILVYIFIYRISHTRIASLVAATIWAIHPMRVESVAWAVERRDVLYTFFYLLALIQYVNYIQQVNSDSSKIKRSYILAIVFFVFSCFSKGMAVSLSLVLPFIDCYLGRRFSKNAILDKIPFFTVSLIFGILVSLAIVSEPGLNKIVERHTMIEKIFFAGYSFIFYLYKFLLPFNLSAYVPYPYESGHVPLYYALFPVFALLLMIVVLLTVRLTKLFITGFGIFICSLVFVLQLWQTNNAMVSDHYTYVPHIGIAFIFGMLFNKLWNYLSFKRISKIVTVLLFATLAGIWSYSSHSRVDVWRNNYNLWSDAVKKTPTPLAYCSLGDYYFGKNEYKEALSCYKNALSINPFYARAFSNRGLVRFKFKDFNRAERDFKRAILVNPLFFEAYINMATLKKDIKQYNEALQYSDKAIEIDPDNHIAYIGRGNIKINNNDVEGALKDFLYSVKLNPHEAWTYFSCANTFFMLKKYQKAKEYYTWGLSLDSTAANAYYLRALSCLHLKDTAEACYSWKKALQLNNMTAAYKLSKYCPMEWNYFAARNRNMAFSQIKYPNGMVKLEVTEDFQNGEIIKKLCHYDQESNLLEKGTINDSAKYNGEIKWYYPNGTVKILGYYKDTIPYGVWKEFYKDSALKATYQYIDGKLNGTYLYYYPNGKLWTERQYRDGKLWNVYSVLDSAGKALFRGDFKNGNGKLLIYNEKGTLAQSITYKNGIIEINNNL